MDWLWDLDMMQVRSLANSYHWMVLRQSPQFLSTLLPCPVGVRGNMSGVQRVSMAFFILSFNSDWRPGLCPASVPLAVSDTGTEMSLEDSSIHSFSTYLQNASSGKVLATVQSQCPQLSATRGKILPFAHLSSEKSCDPGYLSHDDLWDFSSEGNGILRNDGTWIESSSWIQRPISEQRWISFCFLPKAAQVGLDHCLCCQVLLSPVGTLPKL